MNCPASARFGTQRPKVEARTPARSQASSSSSRLLRTFAAFSTLLLAASITGCVPRETPADITIINGAEPESLDPAVVTGIPEMRITKALFEGLTRLDAVTAKPGPGLAERWNISSDGHVYTFYLRTNLLWSTAEPITAADVVWSWTRALAPATASDYAGQLFYIRGAEEFNAGRVTDASTLGIREIDARTVEVQLDQPTAFFLDLCAMPVMAVVPRAVIERHGDRWLSARPLPVSGPFQLETWRVNSKVRLVRNPHYWDAASTASEIIDLLPIGSPNTA
jgi:oligopeptide transport system substrate-binding protein